MRVYIVEDHPVFRLGLKELLEQEEDLEVCGEAEDIPQALEGVRATRPDLAIVDLALKGRNGLDLVKALVEEKCAGAVLVLSMHEESLYAERSLRAGALGYIMKHETSDLIVTAVRRVLAGKIYVSERIMGAMLGRIARTKGQIEAPPEELLTDREMEVFTLIGKGRTTKEISDELCLSPKTIGTYRERLKEKLGHKNSVEVARHAVQWVEGKGI